MSADVGSKAPDFTLTNQDRQPVTLSGATGKNVVLAFFPGSLHVGLPEGALLFSRSPGVAQ